MTSEFDIRHIQYDDSLWTTTFTAGNTQDIPLDMFERDDYYFIEAEIPGTFKQNITLYVERKVLCIDIDRSDSRDNKIIDERKLGRLVRTLKLPEDADTQDIVAKYKDGMLRIKISRLEGEKRRVVEIQ